MNLTGSGCVCALSLCGEACYTMTLTRSLNSRAVTNKLLSIGCHGFTFTCVATSSGNLAI